MRSQLCAFPLHTAGRRLVANHVVAHPPAAPLCAPRQVMAFLNGNVIHALLSWRVYLTKLFGTAASRAAGLALGMEGEPPQPVRAATPRCSPAAHCPAALSASPPRWRLRARRCGCLHVPPLQGPWSTWGPRWHPSSAMPSTVSLAACWACRAGAFQGAVRRLRLPIFHAAQRAASLGPARGPTRPPHPSVPPQTVLYRRLNLHRKGRPGKIERAALAAGLVPHGAEDFLFTNADHRELVSAGAAAGLAAAFGAPIGGAPTPALLGVPRGHVGIRHAATPRRLTRPDKQACRHEQPIRRAGRREPWRHAACAACRTCWPHPGDPAGVLFALEEATSVWSRKLAWRCFLCASVACFSMAQLHPRMNEGGGRRVGGLLLLLPGN